MTISDLPDRQWIEKVYLPELDGRVLYVGMDFYTTHYPTLAPKAALFQFLDFGDSALRFPELGCIQADFLEHTPTEKYDHVSLYGLIGFGTAPERMHDLILHADGMLAPGGTLMLGPNKLPSEPVIVPDDAPDWVRSLALNSRSAHHWKSLFAEPPLDGYVILVEDDDLSQIELNYVWWGRKPKGSP